MTYNLSECRSRCKDCEFNKICIDKGYVLKYRNRYNCEHYDTYVEARNIVKYDFIYAKGEVR